jgi:hypothetical protein
MRFTERERKRIAELADVLIPAAAGHLSASQADIAGQGLDQVLTTCPEMEQSLREVLAKAGSSVAAQAVAGLRQNDPSAFANLAEFAAGAYFLNPAVREAIGYAGQTARLIDPAPDYLEDGLLESVNRRGPIYRPTPTNATRA